MRQLIRNYFKALYSRTMRVAYDTAYNEISRVISGGGKVLDCGAHNGGTYKHLNQTAALSAEHYYGIEWDKQLVLDGQSNGLNIVSGNLNEGINHDDNTFSCVYALSLLEHLLNPCRFLRECSRVLQSGGNLIILTPNISTYFTAALILLGRMPSSGPHPDSDALLKKEELFKVSSDTLQTDVERDTPVHRHLVVFSYRILRDYLTTLGFREVKGYGFGVYPFPVFMQPLMEKIYPFHCHQMIFVARK